MNEQQQELEKEQTIKAMQFGEELTTTPKRNKKEHYEVEKEHYEVESAEWKKRVNRKTRELQ